MLDIFDFLDGRLEIQCQIPNLKSKIPNLKSQNSQSKIQNLKSKIILADDGYAKTQEYPIPNPAAVSLSDRASVEQESPEQLQPAKEH